MTEPAILEVLILEDSPEDKTSVIRRLKNASASPVGSRYRYNVTAVETLRQGLEIAKDKSFDVILLDLTLPDAERLYGVSEIRARLSSIPLIVLTGRDDEDLAREAVHAGAQDYLVKGLHDEIIARTILRSIERQSLFRQLEQARIEALAASEMKSRFLANMSHEIRTPLTSVIGFTESVLTGKLSKDEERMALQRSLSNGRHLLRLLDDVLSFSKIEAGKLTLEMLPCSPYQLCAEVLDDLKLQSVEKGLALRFDARFPLPSSIEIDPTRFKQIIYNLVGNALKFTDVGGVKVTLSCDPTSCTLQVSVRDTGIGMSAETCTTIFDTFTQAEMSTTRRFGGSGLGLSISKQLVEMLNGSISVESKLGEGSTFVFTLPSGPIDKAVMIHSPPEKSVELEVVSEVSPPMCGRVLVVDDMPDNRQLLELVLSKCGLEVVCAESGTSALQMATSEEFDLVLMDMHMPHQDGYQTVSAFRARGLILPIVAVTASAVDTAYDTCINAGCTDFLRKPFEVEHLYKIVEKQLSTSGRMNHSSQRASISMSDEELRPVRRTFLEKLPERLTELETAIRRRDWNVIHQVSHGLCSAGQFGYAELTRVARALERQALAKSDSSLERTWGMLRDIAQKIDS